MVKHDIVVIGASAGGVQALSTLIGALPADLPASIFVVMHSPAHTPSQLPDILRRCTSLAIREANDGETIASGTVYLSRTDRHLMVDREGIRITRGPKECRARPAVDALFRSAAAAFGSRVIGVVLTGMLDDGTAGLWSVKDQGGIALVQDPATAEYPSMPESAISHVEVDSVLALPELAATIARLVNETVDAAPQPPSHRLATENLIAREGNGLKAGVMDLGKVSRYTCPSCHGVLVELKDGRITRFRCHTGHAFSMMTLLAEVNDAIDAGLWDTLRAIEEKLLLLRQRAQLSRDQGDEAAALRFEARARDTEEAVQPLHDLVVSPKLFGPG